MKKSSHGLKFLFCMFVVCHACGATSSFAETSADQQAAEKAIQAAADEFVESFNNRDAKAIAAHWTSDGVYIDANGQRFAGRESIQAEYESLFKSAPDNVEMQVEIDSIRLISPQTAIEEGRAALTPQRVGAVQLMSRYTAVHVKQDGKWMMSDVRESQVLLPPDAGQLEDLQWLEGTWSGANKETATVVEVKCRWIENRRFMERKFQVTKSGKPTSGGRDIIGIDPSTGRITSWSFTGEGGHAVGIWAPHDAGWKIDVVGVLEDGSQTSATNILSRKDEDTLAWNSANRYVGNTYLPDSDEVTLKRK